MNRLKRLLFTGLIEQRDSQPLLKLMESVGDWPVAFEDWNSTMGKTVEGRVPATKKLACVGCQEVLRHVMTLGSE